MSISGLSKARLLRMHDVMAGYVERREVPGLVTLVSRRGEIHVDLIGTQTFNENSPMRRDTIFRVSSMTKPIIAVATMILVEECKLRLDEPVDALLPELAERQVLKRLDGPLDETIPAKRPITVRDLLTFRMGFGQMMAPPDAYPILKEALEQQIGMGPPSPSLLPAPDEWMRRLGRLPLMHQPVREVRRDTPPCMESRAALRGARSQWSLLGVRRWCRFRVRLATEQGQWGDEQSHEQRDKHHT